MLIHISNVVLRTEKLKTTRKAAVAIKRYVASSVLIILIVGGTHLKTTQLTYQCDCEVSFTFFQTQKILISQNQNAIQANFTILFF